MRFESRAPRTPVIRILRHDALLQGDAAAEGRGGGAAAVRRSNSLLICCELTSRIFGECLGFRQRSTGLSAARRDCDELFQPL